MPLTIPSTAWSSGASAKTMFAALPPSSSVSRLPVPASDSLDPLADLGRAGEGDLRDPRVRDERRARRAGAREDVHDAGREVRFLDEAREMERRERRRLGRLQDARVPARERRARASTPPSGAGSSTGSPARRRRAAAPSRAGKA